MFSKHIKKEIAKKPMPPLDLLDKNVFLANLLFCYQYMVASHDLTVLAGNLADGELKKYFTHHADEEKGHAEWLRADLLTEGIDAAEMAISPYARGMVGEQFYNVLYVHPASLLGYMAMLEMNPMPLANVNALEKAHGKALLKTLRFHAEHDIDHSKDLCVVLDALPASLHGVVLQSLDRTADFIRAGLDRINEFNRETVGRLH